MSRFRDVEPELLARVTGGAPNPEMMMNVVMELAKAKRGDDLTMVMLRVMMILMGGSAPKTETPKTEPPKA